MIRRSVLSAVLALAVAAPVAVVHAADPAVQAQQPVKEKKVCRRDVATGSIMAKSTCRTKADWDAITAQAKSDLEKVRNIEVTHQQVGIQR